MKITIWLGMLTVASVSAAGQGSVSAWQSFGGAMGESPEVTVLESDQNHMLLEISIPAPGHHRRQPHRTGMELC